MIPPERIALILLAAGRSRRFGDADKLTQDLLGQPLALHVVTTLAPLPFLARIAITSGTAVDFAAHGYHMIDNDRPEIGMSHSVKLGIAAARDMNADAALIVLADMPRITVTHVLRLLDGADGAAAVVASSDGTKPSPPAIFGADHFDALLDLHGDQGARALIAGGRHVIAPTAELSDIDRREDLDRLRALG